MPAPHQLQLNGLISPVSGRGGSSPLRHAARHTIQDVCHRAAVGGRRRQLLPVRASQLARLRRGPDLGGHLH